MKEHNVKITAVFCSIIVCAFLLLFSGIVNACVGERWLATVGGTNLLDEVYIVSGLDYDGTGITAASPSRPLEWYVRLRYTF